MYRCETACVELLDEKDVLEVEISQEIVVTSNQDYDFTEESTYWSKPDEPVKWPYDWKTDEGYSIISSEDVWDIGMEQVDQEFAKMLHSPLSKPGKYKITGILLIPYTITNIEVCRTYIPEPEGDCSYHDELISEPESDIDKKNVKIQDFKVIEIE